MAACGERDETLEPRLVDLDIARRGGEHPAAVDQEGLGGVGPDRHLAGMVIAAR